MNTLRDRDGISGFTKRSESEYDVFGAGHSSTSEVGRRPCASLPFEVHIESVAGLAPRSILCSFLQESVNFNKGFLDEAKIEISNEFFIFT